LSTSDVSALLSRAAAASAANNAIIVVVDRTGQILGVRVESGVSTAITSNPTNLVFAIDGAYAEALTGAYFANNQAPLTSRTVQFISQSTITQQEVDSNPDIANQNSTLYGPGAVAPVEIGGHFPPGIALTPTVDLAQIEFTNRDQSEINGVPLSSRFNINLSYVPAGNELYAPDSYGLVSGLLPTAQSRGIGTLPGGVPIYKDGNLVGGIGVFFPGTTGYATEENSALSSTYDPSKPDLSLEAEWMAFAAVGGNAAGGGALTALPAPIGTLGGVPLPAGIAGLPSGRIDLVGITLPVIGPGNPQNGLAAILAEGQAVGQGNPNDGINEPVDTTGGHPPQREVGTIGLAGSPAQRGGDHAAASRADYHPGDHPGGPDPRGDSASGRRPGAVRLRGHRPGRECGRAVPPAGRDRVLDRCGRRQGPKRGILR
jgi:hypothetical protein